MRSEELPLEGYDSDKIPSRYMERYDPMFEPWVGKKIALLELGIYRGGSLLLWRDYFPMGTIVGVDIDLPKELAPTERIYLYEGNQTDTAFLSRMAGEIAPEGFDIIIDDASHFGRPTAIAFWHLFDHHLKPGGIYAIEDWGTGYWEDWPDGASLHLDPHLQPPRVDDPKTPFPCHSHGMVGFAKQLIDEQGARSATKQRSTGQPTREPRFENVTFTPGIIFVRKRISNLV